MPYLIFLEWDTPGLAHVKVFKRIIDYRVSKYQEIIVAETEDFGKLLVLDGKTQSSEADEFVYHESLVHPAMVLHGSPRRVLILGGGEGATAREVLKYRSVEKVVMVDIDEEVIKVSREHLEFMNRGVFEDPRLELVIGDALDYVFSTSEKFDVVIADLSDPVEAGPSYKLYTREFYERVRSIMEENGVFVTQATSPSSTPRTHSIIYNTVRSVFKHTAYYHVYVPSFQSLWGFVIASDYKDPESLEAELVDEALARLGVETRFYDSIAHKHIFSVPRYLRARIEAEKTVATMDSPAFMPA
ncbi:MAG: polyamine aminopropyltransferase [Acidilobaceae archaeon]